MSPLRSPAVPAVRYAWAGIACGLCLSFFAWLLDVWQHHAQWTVASIWMLYLHNPLHWVIATAPVVLGVIGYHYGKVRRRHLTTQHHHQFIEAVIQTADCLIVVVDRQGRILRFNRACEQATGYTAIEVLSQSFADLFLMPDDLPGVSTVMERLIAGEEAVRHENAWRTKTGAHRMVAWSNTALRDSTGAITYLIGTGVDITEQQRLEQERQQLVQQLHEQANLDGLTGIANRRSFWVAATNMLQHEPAASATMSVLLFDIDHFKTVNDTYGHTTGDEVLHALAERCHAHLRPTDLVARYGGEEFVVALPNTALNMAWEIAERLRRAVADLPITTASGPVHLTISGGLAQSTAAGLDLPTLVQHADRALYLAKQRGRNCIVTFDQTQIHRDAPELTTVDERTRRHHERTADVAF